MRMLRNIVYKTTPVPLQIVANVDCFFIPQDPPKIVLPSDGGMACFRQ